MTSDGYVISDGFVIMYLSEAQDIMHLLRHLNKLNTVIDLANAVELDHAIKTFQRSGGYFRTIDQGTSNEV